MACLWCLQMPADTFEQKLTLIGLIGLQDPLRSDVPDAIAACHRAGIKVRMLTGDNARTAANIARDCGILPPDISVEQVLNDSHVLMRRVFQTVSSVQSMASASLTSMDTIPAEALALHNASIPSPTATTTGQSVQTSPLTTASNTKQQTWLTHALTSTTSTPKQARDGDGYDMDWELPTFADLEDGAPWDGADHHSQISTASSVTAENVSPGRTHAGILPYRNSLDEEDDYEGVLAGYGTHTRHHHHQQQQQRIHGHHSHDGAVSHDSVVHHVIQQAYHDNNPTPLTQPSANTKLAEVTQSNESLQQTATALITESTHQESNRERDLHTADTSQVENRFQTSLYDGHGPLVLEGPQFRQLVTKPDNTLDLHALR